ncbi:hypothetical protein FRX31_024031 [Thalictrum thalictroides]|uniref:Uncharacterized protein n=1 Tax=Thalictrum thalictroides TaxID=46969 RepID=A0A7J6VQA0_THATH|nr:hypothetical protein FRX31_024031 [Thalictrum thalictroides]
MSSLQPCFTPIRTQTLSTISSADNCKISGFTGTRTATPVTKVCNDTRLRSGTSSANSINPHSFGLTEGMDQSNQRMQHQQLMTRTICSDRKTDLVSLGDNK